jgi:hypothetical protein
MEFRGVHLETVLNPGIHDVKLLDGRTIIGREQRLFPLPGGEGQGEGEREPNKSVNLRSVNWWDDSPHPGPLPSIRWSGEGETFAASGGFAAVGDSRDDFASSQYADQIQEPCEVATSFGDDSSFVIRHSSLQP